MAAKQIKMYTIHDWHLDNLCKCIDVVAALTAVHTLAYQKGFDDATMLREFVNPDYVPHPYFPTGDTRPTAERLAWGIQKQLETE